ncbi:MAG: hypothetical protein DCC67_02075, partial [Planctomycetota bacterium]
VGASIRGLYVRGCYFTFFDHLAGAYLINPSDSPDSGWYLNKPHGRNFAWQVTKGYDTSFEDCSFRGWYVGGEFRHNDRFLARNWRGGHNGRVIDVYGIQGSAPVPAAIYGLWSEGHWVVGANLESCEVHGLNAESGYIADYEPNIGDQDYNNDNPPLGADVNLKDDDPRRLLPSITWSILKGGGTVYFDNLPSSRILSDYFDVRTVVRFEPDQPDEPARYLYIHAIDDFGRTLLFKNPTTTSYIHRTGGVSGDGGGITRYLGTGANLVGDKTAMIGHNVHVNNYLGDCDHVLTETAEGPGDFPLGFIVPGAMPTLVSGGVSGVTKNTSDRTTRWAVVADCAGTQFNVCGGVRWIGADAPDHPLVLRDGEPHMEYDPNVRSIATTGVQVPRDTNGDGAIDYYATVYRAYPGRGVSQANNWARDLRFRRQADGALGRDVWVYRLTDTPNGWVVTGLRKNMKPIDYSIRLRATAATSTLQVFGGALSDSIPISGADWHTVYGHLDATQVDADGEVWISGANIDVAWVELLREE